MKSQTIVFCLCLFVQFSGTAAQQQTAQYSQRRVERANRVDQKSAIAIANRAAGKTYKRLERLAIVPCEGIVLWRIIYDGGGPEYVIDKRSGMIIKVEHLPQGSSSNGGKAGSNPGKNMSELEAIEIAKRDARAEYGDREDVDKYNVRACEEAKAWRIVFDFKPPIGSRDDQLILPHGSMPQYVIDKASGKILYRARD